MYVSEVLFGIIAFYPDTRFPVTPKILHPALFEMRKRYPYVFDEFCFSRNGFYYSREVDCYIELFRTAGILESSSSDTPEILEGLKEDCRRNWRSDRKKVDTLEQISKELYNIIIPTPVA